MLHNVEFVRHRPHVKQTRPHRRRLHSLFRKSIMWKVKCMLYNISLSKKVILDSEIFVKQLKVPKCFEVGQLSILRIYELILLRTPQYCFRVLSMLYSARWKYIHVVLTHAAMVKTASAPNLLSNFVCAS